MVECTAAMKETRLRRNNYFLKIPSHYDDASFINEEYFQTDLIEDYGFYRTKQAAGKKLYELVRLIYKTVVFPTQCSNLSGMHIADTFNGRGENQTSSCGTSCLLL